MVVSLVTGANKGLGHETARRLVEAGHEVWIGSRDLDRGTQAANEFGAQALQLDVTDDTSVETAVETMRAKTGHLDLLVNNAGILGAVAPTEQLTLADYRAVYETNVFGLLRVTRAFLPLLRAGEDPSVINVTSGLGSFTLIHDPERVESQYLLAAYASSKTAVTMLTVQWARTVPGIRFNAVDPGQTATELTGGVGQGVERGAEPIVRMALLGADAPTGTVTDLAGVVPW